MNHVKYDIPLQTKVNGAEHCDIAHEKYSSDWKRIFFYLLGVLIGNNRKPFIHEMGRQFPQIL